MLLLLRPHAADDDPGVTDHEGAAQLEIVFLVSATHEDTWTLVVEEESVLTLTAIDEQEM
jgi:hypothetical protein